MDKKSKAKKKTMGKDLALKLNAKLLFIQSNFCKYYLDSNNSGDLFLNSSERPPFQKWEFQIADEPGFYFIKNLSTGLYFSSNHLGELFCNVLNPYSSYQRWRINLTSDVDSYCISNVGNDLLLCCSKMNKLFMQIFEEKKLLNELEVCYSFLMYPKKPERR